MQVIRLFGELVYKVIVFRPLVAVERVFVWFKYLLGSLEHHDNVLILVLLEKNIAFVHRQCFDGQ